MTIRELSGDVNLTKAQIDETQIIVTTPEKCWSQGFMMYHVAFEGIKRLKSWGLGHTATDFGFLGHSLKGGTSSHERLVTSVGEHRTAHQSMFPRRGSEWKGHQCHVNLPGAYTQLVRLVIIDESDPELNKIQIEFAVRRNC